MIVRNNRKRFHTKFMTYKPTELLVYLVSAILLSGCGTLARERAVPPQLHGQEQIGNMPGVRYEALSEAGIQKILGDIKEKQKQPKPKPIQMKLPTTYLSQAVVTMGHLVRDF